LHELKVLEAVSMKLYVKYRILFYAVPQHSQRGIEKGFLNDWSVSLSFAGRAVLAAVSPEVVMPLLLNLQTKGSYGKAKGIPTIVIAAASFDDFVAISAFGVLLNIATSTGNPHTTQTTLFTLILYWTLPII
jgi:NhaP-type Na+/H+ or K+/H+ antiporter